MALGASMGAGIQELAGEGGFSIRSCIGIYWPECSKCSNAIPSNSFHNCCGTRGAGGGEG